MVYEGLSKLITLIRENPYYNEKEDERKSYDYDNLTLLENLGKVSYQYTIQYLNTVGKIKSESMNRYELIQYHFRNALKRESLYRAKLYEPLTEKLLIDWPYIPIVLLISVILLIPLAIAGMTTSDENPLKATCFFVAFAFDSIPLLVLLLSKLIDSIHEIYYEKILFFSEELDNWNWIELGKRKEIEITEFTNSDNLSYIRKAKTSIVKVIDANIIKNIRMINDENDLGIIKIL